MMQSAGATNGGSSSSLSSRQPQEANLESFISAISSIPAEEWQKRVLALKQLVDSIPDYSTINEQGHDESNNDGDEKIKNNNVNGLSRNLPWYRSSVSVRRLYFPLKTLLLDARSAVVKDATELIRVLLMVKLQPGPSSMSIPDGQGAAERDKTKCEDGNLETITNGGVQQSHHHQRQQPLPPPPAFVGRLLIKDLMPVILDLSKQTVKVIRSYGVKMTIDILPLCRVKSIIPVLLERMKTHINRTVREDCARYLRCILETWPTMITTGHSSFDGENNHGISRRADESLSFDSAKQIGLGLGHSLSDSAKPVRDEARLAFQVLFTKLRPVWDDVMRAGAVRDVRLRKKLIDAAAITISGSDGNLFDDMVSVGEMSLNSAVSGLSHASYRSNMSHRSHVSRSMMGTSGVPSVIGTPKVSPRRIGSNLQTNSPRYMQGTGSSAGKVHVKEASDKYSTHNYVTSTGHVLSTPSPRRAVAVRERNGAIQTPQQPFASLLETPSRQMTPEFSQTPCKILRKRLSSRISGAKPGLYEHIQSSPTHLTSIDEAEDCNEQATPSANNDIHSSEITNVALEVIAAHLSHLEEIESLLNKEKDLLRGLNRQLGISITNGMMASELAESLVSLSEEKVCDYFESVHMVVEQQKNAADDLLREMERISQGEGSSESRVERSPLGVKDEEGIQRNLKDDFCVASYSKRL